MTPYQQQELVAICSISSVVLLIMLMFLLVFTDDLNKVKVKLLYKLFKYQSKDTATLYKILQTSIPENWDINNLYLNHKSLDLKVPLWNTHYVIFNNIRYYIHSDCNIEISKLYNQCKELYSYSKK